MGKLKAFVRRIARPTYHLIQILAGGLLMAISVNIFMDPNNVVPGGFTAVSMFANRLWGLPIGATLFALNVPFLIVGVRVLGAEFGPKTILSAVWVSAAIDLLRPYLQPYQVRGDPLLYIAYGGLLFGLGMALVFRTGATSGGTETPAKLMQHFFGIRMATSLLAMDIVILALAAAVFDLKGALYALMSAWIQARVIDFMEHGVTASDTAFIVTERPDPVRDAILQKLERGVTLLTGAGGYTGTPRVILFTVVNRRQVNTLREIVSHADPDAFVVISPSNEVLGEGFKPLTRVRSRVRPG